MQLHVFQSDNGDCLLLESDDGKRILCDGGMAHSMREHVRDILGKMRDAGERLDFIYISHIDQDHISGVVQLLEDELEWRLFDHHERNGTPINEPDFPRPPEIGGIWHNAFHDQIGKNGGDVADLLAAAAPALLASAVPVLTNLGAAFQNIALSIPDAIRVSRYASPNLLRIPVNRLPGSQETSKLLMFREDQDSFELGSMRLTIVGPTEDELTQLRDGWNNFLRDVENRQQLKELRAEIRRKVDAFGEEHFDLRDWNGIPDFKGVTVPNIASLMFMVEEGDKRLLLTGDSQQDIILKGLKLAGFLEDGHLHVNVLKVQHHASEHNVDANFCRIVSADNYVFCGNGLHGNPEPSVIKTIYNSRLGPKAVRALSPKAADRDFKFWFSTNAEAQTAGSERRNVFDTVETLVAELERKSRGRLTAEFNTKAKLVIEI
jgi:hypothetical protein